MKDTTHIPRLPAHRVHRDLALLVLIVICSALPFLSQPYHMDDNFYLDMARGVRSNPVHPYDQPYDFGGFHVPDMASHSHPPFQSYFLAMVGIFAGDGEGKEWMFHAAAMFFPLLAVVSLYFLSARFVERPFWPSVALASCPLFLVMQHNLMADIPTLAFWLAAVAAFLWASESHRNSLYAASSLMQLAAMFTSYQAVSLLPLLGYYHIRRKGRFAGWIALLVPVVCMGLWQLMNYLHYGRMVLLDTLGYVQSRNAVSPGVLLMKLVSFLEYQGWLIVFPLFLIYIFARDLRGRLFGLAILASIVLAQIMLPQADYRLSDRIIFVIGLATGAFVLLRMASMIRDAFGKREAGRGLGFDLLESQFLVLWYFGVTAYCLIMLAEGSARYILPLIPPVLIVYFKGLEITEVKEYRVSRPPLLNAAMVASGSVVLSLAWGLLLAQADFEFARVYPRSAAAFLRLSDGLDSYITGEWGFRYYFGRAGAMPLPEDESAVKGASLLVVPKLAMPYGLPAALDSMSIPFTSLSFALKTPLRTMDWQTPAGFYSTGWGWIPFSLSQESLETLEIRQVSFMVERLPWAHVESVSGLRPWPGYVPGGTRQLAVLAAPGTRIAYPWTLRHPADLLVEIGVIHDPASASDGEFVFEIRRCDAGGAVLAGIERILNPASGGEEAIRQTIRLTLPPGMADGETLEFYYTKSGSVSVTGAFIGGIIVPR